MLFRRPGPRAALAMTLTLAACASAQPGPPPGRPASGPPFVECRGTPSDAPAVILEAGAFETAADWDLVMTDLAPGGRVCAYSRPGLGASPPRNRAPTVAAIAADLGRVLDQIGERRPVIVVGHSNGALYAETFARQSPERVAGLVYVDGVNSAAAASPEIMAALHRERQSARLAVVGGQAGLARAMAETVVGRVGLRGAAADRKRDAMTSLDHLKASYREARQIIPGVRATRRLPPLDPRIPIAVLIAAEFPDAELAQDWRRIQVASAAGAARSWVLDMPGATHVSPLGRDRAYVTAAVDWLRGLTTGARPSAPPASPAPGRGLSTEP
jgi:pimeloyl-ACP methyl ester carboxylesterase